MTQTHLALARQICIANLKAKEQVLVEIEQGGSQTGQNHTNVNNSGHKVATIINSLAPRKTHIYDPYNTHICAPVHRTFQRQSMCTC